MGKKYNFLCKKKKKALQKTTAKLSKHHFYIFAMIKTMNEKGNKWRINFNNNCFGAVQITTTFLL